MVLFSLFHFSWSCYSNGRLLQLIECIESLKSDVKKKMMRTRACDPCTKVTCEGWRRNFRECNSLCRTFPVQNLFDTRNLEFRYRRRGSEHQTQLPALTVPERLRISIIIPPRASIIG